MLRRDTENMSRNQDKRPRNIVFGFRRRHVVGSLLTGVNVQRRRKSQKMSHLHGSRSDQEIRLRSSEDDNSKKRTERVFSCVGSIHRFSSHGGKILFPHRIGKKTFDVNFGL